MSQPSSASRETLIEPKGRLGVLLPGISGAVSTTFISGVEAIKRGLAKPIGSLTQYGKIRLSGGDGSADGLADIKDVFPLADFSELEFAGWDIFPDDAYQAALKAGVLEKDLLDSVRDSLEKIRPMPAVFDTEYVRKLDGPNKKSGASKMELAEQLVADIEEFRARSGVERLVAVWCGSTEVYIRPSDVHADLDRFERGLKENDPLISPSMIYAYAAIKAGVPYANGAPNLAADIPALVELADRNRVPIAGKDFKTGQTLLKTIVAPGLMSRKLGVRGWFSTNILGNRDGEVLDDPGSFRTKEESKLSVLDSIFVPELFPELYEQCYHKVRINYYPPRGDQKEAWDNIDIFGWLGYPMQIKINFLCRDSILAAPVVLDLVLFLDLAQRAGLYGIQEWLSFYFKSPMVADSIQPVHDVFLQLIKLKTMLKRLVGDHTMAEIGLEPEDVYDIS